MAKPLSGQVVLPEYDQILGYKEYKRTPEILAFADVHLGNYRYPIRDYIISGLEQIADMVQQHKPNLVIFAGDAFRTKVPSAADVSALGDIIAKMAKHSRVLMIPGNHDITGQGHTTLDVYANYDNVWLYKEPQVVDMDYYELVMVPWLPQRALSSFGLEGQDNTAITEILIQLLKNTLTPGKMHILVAHCTSFGTSYGDVNVIMGRDVLWLPDWFSGFDLTILGHLHKPQVVPGTTDVYYTGSVCPVSFNESGHRKSVLVYEDGYAAHEFLDSPMFIRATPNELDNIGTRNCFLQVRRPHDEDDPPIPDCLWYEIIPEKPPRLRRQRLDSDEAANMTPMEAIEAYLQEEGVLPDPILKLASKLLEED